MPFSQITFDNQKIIKWFKENEHLNIKNVVLILNNIFYRNDPANIFYATERYTVIKNSDIDVINVYFYAILEDDDIANYGFRLYNKPLPRTAYRIIPCNPIKSNNRIIFQRNSYEYANIIGVRISGQLVVNKYGVETRIMFQNHFYPIGVNDLKHSFKFSYTSNIELSTEFPIMRNELTAHIVADNKSAGWYGIKTSKPKLEIGINNADWVYMPKVKIKYFEYFHRPYNGATEVFRSQNIMYVSDSLHRLNYINGVLYDNTNEPYQSKIYVVYME